MLLIVIVSIGFEACHRVVRFHLGAPSLCVSAETVDSSTAVEAKGSSPLEVRKTFSMVLLEVRILLYTPSYGGRC